MGQIPDRINKYKCLVKRDGKFILGIITNTNIYAYDNSRQRLATLAQRTKFKYFTECILIKVTNPIDIGSQYKYSVNNKWYYVVEEGSTVVDSLTGESIHEYVIGR